MRHGAWWAIALLAVAASPLATGPLAAQSDSTTPKRGPRDRVELEGFIDGLITAQLRDRHVAGATVAVVKDGALFFAKGYGYADVSRRTPVDPAVTMFRVGSVSKLFTWTAVMQLVERGKLDLNRDINEYLDFKIPATFPEPITLTNVMTHAPGLEDDLRDLFTEDPAHITPMAKWLPAHLPKRVRPPGTFSSYSNWATATAGYIVERVSGMPFDDYVEQNIFQPLGMTRTTFRQPLPAALAPGMSVGYRYENGRFEAKKYEIATGAWPAGSVAATATDMARFMIAHLANGAGPGGQRILAESTAVKMHGRVFGHDPRIPGFAYGFYEQSSHGLRIIGHGGDTQWFHSNLALIPSENVGVFVSFNTDRGGALTEPFTDAFLDHYYPTPEPWIASTATPEQLRRFAGQYLGNRMNYSTFLKALSLPGAASITVADSGALLANLGGSPIRLVPVDSLLFRDENGDVRVAFRADSEGRITHAFVSDDPTSALVKMTGAGAPRFHLFILGLGVAVFALTIIAAVIRVFTRRGVARLPDRTILVAMALAFLLTAVAATMVKVNVTSLLHNELGGVKIVLLFPVIGAVLAVVALVAMVRQWRSGAGTLLARARYTFVVLVAVAVVWSLNSWNFLGWRM